MDDCGVIFGVYLDKDDPTPILLDHQAWQWKLCPECGRCSACHHIYDCKETFRPVIGDRDHVVLWDGVDVRI
jgi:hypothetical protein